MVKTLRGLFVLRQLLSNINMLVIPQQLAVHGADNAFAEDGGLADSGQQAMVAGIGKRVAETIARLDG